MKRFIDGKEATEYEIPCKVCNKAMGLLTIEQPGTAMIINCSCGGNTPFIIPGGQAEVVDGRPYTFEEIIKPVIRWLCENHNPHTTIIVTPTDAELLSGELAFRTTEFLKD